jgi:hypothetical protein
MSEAARMRAEAADMKVDPLTIKPMNDRIVVDYSGAGLDPITAKMPIAGAPALTAPDWLAKSEAELAAGDTWIRNVSAQTGLPPAALVLVGGNDAFRQGGGVSRRDGRATNLDDLTRSRTGAKPRTRWEDDQISPEGLRSIGTKYGRSRPNVKQIEGDRLDMMDLERSIVQQAGGRYGRPTSRQTLPDGTVVRSYGKDLQITHRTADQSSSGVPAMDVRWGGKVTKFHFTGRDWMARAPR